MAIIEYSKLRMPTSMPDLSLIGVPESQQNRAPSVVSFPLKFNRVGRPVWEKMMKDELFKKKLGAYDDLEERWRLAIIEFMNRCDAQSIPAFPSITQQEKNDYAIQYLTSARIALVKFFNGVEMFNRVKVQKVCRDYKLRETGLEVTSYATLRPVLDPTFEKWLTTAPNPRFLMQADQLYMRHLQPNLWAWVRYRNSTRVTLGFDIRVGVGVSVPGKRVATKKEVYNYIDRSIWLPIVRAHRFDGCKQRLF